MQEHTTEGTFALQDHVRSLHLPDVPVPEARARLRSSLLAAGFTTMADLDLADLLNRRLDEQIDPYYLMDACHPWLARQALDVAWDAGFLMPTRLCVWKAGQGSVVATLQPTRVVEAIGLPHLLPVAARIEERLDLVFDRLGEPLPPGLADVEVPGP
jgi:uncharacterized protein (DUF302 family)